MQIRKKDAEEVVELLRSHDQELDDLFEIWKQTAFEEAEEPEPRP